MRFIFPKKKYFITINGGREKEIKSSIWINYLSYTYDYNFFCIWVRDFMETKSSSYTYDKQSLI
tara:strand:- start:27116 stop:27307 length:192 start_codon:yes stop_codon:yes gene_type:complete